MGDASGVGPEILLRAFASGELGTDVVAVGDLAVLDLCNRRLHCDVTLEPLTAPRPATPGVLGVLDEGALSEQTLRIGEIDRASGAAALAYVARATRLALAGDAAAVVTLPINKAATRLSAPTFTGHTEYVAELCGRTSSTLMLASERAIVTHVSTHVSLREAIALAQPARILEVIVQTDEILRRLRPTRRIAVAGLNPHAGEGRAFGDEDDTCIAPAIARARDQGLEVSGPHPPDTVFLDMVQGRDRRGRVHVPRPGPHPDEAARLPRRRERHARPADRAHVGRPRDGVRHRVEGRRLHRFAARRLRDGATSVPPLAAAHRLQDQDRPRLQMDAVAAAGVGQHLDDLSHAGPVRLRDAGVEQVAEPQLEGFRGQRPIERDERAAARQRHQLDAGDAAQRARRAHHDHRPPSVARQFGFAGRRPIRPRRRGELDDGAGQIRIVPFEHRDDVERQRQRHRARRPAELAGASTLRGAGAVSRIGM